MDNPGAFYAVALHTPHLRDALTSDDPRPARPQRRPHPSVRPGAVLRHGLAQALRAVADHLDTPPSVGEPWLGPA
jgi:hypothetical protein